jgi:hypothetical protein
VQFGRIDDSEQTIDDLREYRSILIVPFTEQPSFLNFCADDVPYTRFQIPLALASAITTHKAQSLTAPYGVVLKLANNSPFARSLPYVALSRATEIAKVLLISPALPTHFHSHLAQRYSIDDEYQHLRNHFPL